MTGDKHVGLTLNALDAVYCSLTKYMDKETKEDITEKQFLRTHSDLHEDLGSYVSREYLGSINVGPFTDPVEKYPEAIRHVWRGIFEQHEVFIHVGIYTENGARRIGEASFK